MADPTTTLKTIRQKVIKKLYAPHYPIVSTTTGAGADTASVVDSALAPSGQVEDYRGKWVYIAETETGSPVVGTVVRVTNVNFSGANSYLITAPAFSDSLNSGMDYEIHYEFHPGHVKDKINEILENMRRDVVVPLSLLTNPNFDLDTTGWTGSSVTQAVTTDYSVFGQRSLSIQSSGANAYSGQTLWVHEKVPLLVAADVQNIAANYDALVKIVDSAGATVEYGQMDERGWAHLEFACETPANNISISVRLQPGTAHTIVVDNVIVLRRDTHVIDLPTAIEWPTEALDVFYAPLGAEIGGTDARNCYQLLPKPLEKWCEGKLLRDALAVTATRVELLNKKEITAPLYVKGRVDFSVLSIDADTTSAPEDVLVDLVYAELVEELAQRDLENNNQVGFELKMAKVKMIRNKLDPRARQLFGGRGVVHGAFK